MGLWGRICSARGRLIDFGLLTPMHVTIQIPITDIRPTADNSAPRIAAPNWGHLTKYKDFTRSFGVIEQRQRGVGAVSGEDLYVSARKAIRMADGFGSKPIEVGDCEVLFECTFRRFFFDGEMAARFEIGFTLRRSSQRAIAEKGQKLDASAVILALLDVRCRIPGVEKDIAVRDLGKHLAELWIRSTTPKAKEQAANYRYWVGRDLRKGPAAQPDSNGPWAVAGELVAIVETKPGIPLQVSGQIVKIPEDVGKLPEAVYFITPSKALRIPVWVFGWNESEQFIGADRSKPIRHLRLLLLRTHSDRESLWSLANYFSRRDTPPTEAEIGRFGTLLASRSGLLIPRSSVYASEKYGILDWKLCMMAHEIEKVAVPGFEADLENMKKIFPESVVAMLEHNAGYKHLQARLNLVVVENKSGKLGNQIFVLGDNSGNIAIADTIKDSFNTEPPLKTG